MLAAVGEQLVGALQRGLEHALVDVALVASATASRRKEQIVEAAGVTGLVLGEDVVKDRQQVDRAQPRRRLGPSHLEATAGEVDVAHERVAHLVIARTGEHESRDQRIAARRARRCRAIQLSRRVEQRDELIHAIEVHRPRLGGLELAPAGVDPDRVAGNQLVLDGDLEDLPEAGDGLVDRLGGQRRFVNLGLAIAVDLGDRDLGQTMRGEEREQVIAQLPLAVEDGVGCPLAPMGGDHSLANLWNVGSDSTST